MILASAAFTVLSQWGNHVYKSLPEVTVEHDGSAMPSLSIVIPARNEATNLRRLLPSLTAARYAGDLEIIVVDDNSTDETMAVADEYGVRVIRVDDLPANWLGKPHACHIGARAATGAWLLFVDADTFHAPQCAAAAVQFASRQRLDGLSLMLKNEFLGLADGIAFIVAFAALFAGRCSAGSILNGQFILMCSDVYWRSGGHAAVANEAMEDLALGRRLREQGYVVPLVRGEKLATVHMYPNYRAWWSGLSRWGSRSLRATDVNSVVTGLFVMAAMYPVLFLLRAIRRQLRWRQAFAAWAVVALNLLPWARRFGKGWWAAFAPLGALLIQVAATSGLVRDLLWRGTFWKDRAI